MSKRGSKPTVQNSLADEDIGRMASLKQRYLTNKKLTTLQGKNQNMRKGDDQNFT